jgi:hypothetical protein
MSAAPSAELPQAGWRAPAGGLPAALAPVVVIGLAAILLQWRFGLLGDVSWLITVDEKWLDGATPYRDIIEVNPPASLMLYGPAVALARVLGVAPEFTVAAFGFLSIAAGLGLAAAILRRAGLLDRLGALGGAVAIVAFAVLPGQSFDERDHLAAVYGLPFLAVSAARAARAPVDGRLALLAGLGAGLMAAIKPPYALVAIVLLPYLVRRAGVVPLLKAVEYWVAAAFGLAYIAAVPRAFPDYVANILPISLDVYAPIREPMASLLAAPGPLFAFILVVCALRLARDDAGEPLVAIPALAGLGALAAYLVQGKGWLYQAYPALALFALAAGAALARAPQPRPRVALGALAFLAAALSLLALGRWPLPLAFVAAGAGAALAWVLEGRKGVAPIAEMGVAAALGAACGLFAMDGIETPALARALASLGPHPTVASLSESLAFGHPMVRRVGGVWDQSVPSLWIAAAARRRIDENPANAALAERMRVYIDADRDRLAADLERSRPDALLVGRLDTRFHQWVWNDPEITAARADYRLFASETDSGFPAELWVRSDLFGLRPRLPDGEVGKP